MRDATKAVRVRRALAAFAVLGLVYGITAHVARDHLPRRIWLRVHFLEDVELIPTYPSLAEEAVFLVRSEILPQSAAVSTARVLAGLVLGVVVGVPLGVAMGRARWLESLAEPAVLLVRFTPALALLPLYVLWFGLGEGSKIALIATSVAVVMQQGAFEGARGVPRVYLDAAAALGATGRLRLQRVVVPAALPHLLASARIALGLGWVTIVVAELIKPEMPSLGYLLALGGAYPRVPTIMIAIATVGALVLVSDLLFLAAYRHATRWMRRHGG